jgi:cyanate permease
MDAGAAPHENEEMTQAVQSRCKAIFRGNKISTKNESKEFYQTPYRWVMLSLLWLLYASFGLVNRSIAPLVTPILRDLDITYYQMGTILGSWQLTYIMVSIVAGAIIDNWGIRKSLFAGAIMIGLSSLLRYFPKGFAGMLFAVALFGVGGPMISIGCPKTISIWFRGRSRGTAVGIYMTGNYFGSLVALTLTNSFVMPLTGYAWGLAFVCYAFVAFSVAFFWWLLAKDISLPLSTENPSIIETFTKLIRIRNVQIVLIMGFLSFATLNGLNNWLPKILEGKGSSPVSAGYVASIPIAAGIPSLLVIPRFVRPQFRGSFVALSAFLTIVTLLLIVNTSGIINVVVLSLYGITASAFVPILTLILMDTPAVEPRLMGSAGGLFFCIAEIGGFVGPFLMGALVDLTSTFLAGIIFFAILNAAILALTFMIETRPALESTGQTGQNILD